MKSINVERTIVKVVIRPFWKEIDSNVIPKTESRIRHKIYRQVDAVVRGMPWVQMVNTLHENVI